MMTSKSKMIFLIFFAALLVTETTAAERLIHRASCSLTTPGTEKNVPCYADVATDTATHITRLRIYAESGTGREVYEHVIEAGQEFVQNVGSMYLTGLGRVFFVEWQWGAINTGLTIYNLSADGRIREIMRDGGLYGFYVVSLPDEDRALRVILVDRDDSDHTRIAKIYSVTKEGGFGKPKIIRAKNAFWFELKGN